MHLNSYAPSHDSLYFIILGHLENESFVKYFSITIVY